MAQPQPPPDSGQVLNELQQYLDPSLEAQAGAPVAVELDITPDGETTDDIDPEPAPVALDDRTLDLARQAAAPPWYASWFTVLLVPAAPALGILFGINGGGVEILSFSAFAVVLLVLFGPVVGLVWLAVFVNHRDRIRPIRVALDDGAALSITGPIAQTGSRSISVGETDIEAVHHVELPNWARTAQCNVIFGRYDSGPNTPRRRIRVRQTLISIAGPDGRQVYPPVGAIPAILRVPAVVASILVSLAMTTAFNAQTQTYSAAAAHLRDIEAMSQCTATSTPGSDCYRWVPGTIALDFWYSVDSTNGSVSDSTCRAILRWGNHVQAGDVRVQSVDCTQQISSTPSPAKLQVLKDYVIQVQVGKTVYQTDHWPPLGDTVFTLALVFQLLTILWIGWPIAHLAWAIGYRIWRTTATQTASTPSPPVPAPGSAT